MSLLPFSASDKTDALGKIAEEFYTHVLFDEQPLFVSDEATVWDIWSGDEQEILQRCSKFYGVSVSKEETRLPFWKFVLLLKRRRRSTELTTGIPSDLHTELWTSWGSLLRSYAAAHGLNKHQFAVIEFGEEQIILRFGSKWVRFTHDQEESSDGTFASFALNEDGTVTVGSETDEMDFAAERITRHLMAP